MKRVIEKRTPGPWMAEVQASGAVTVRRADGNGEPIAEIWHNGHDPEANGALVAAAPDLFEALSAFDADLSRTWGSPHSQEAARGMIPSRRECWRQARVALDLAAQVKVPTP